MNYWGLSKGGFCVLLLVLSPFSLCAQAYDGVLAEDVYIKLEFVDCYRGDSCPRYEVTVLGNGTVIYEGISGVSKTGVFQKTINKQKVADLLTKLLKLRFFTRRDGAADCPTRVELIGGNYTEDGEKVCIISSHGPFTDIKVRFGSKKRQVNLEHYFSDDYLEIKQAIIKTAGAESFIE